MIPSSRQIEALRVLHKHTDGTYDFWRLAGPRGASARHEVLFAITGVKPKKSLIGVNAVRDALMEMSGAFGVSQRSQDIAFFEWARAHAGN